MTGTGRSFEQDGPGKASQSSVERLSGQVGTADPSKINNSDLAPCGGLAADPPPRVIDRALRVVNGCRCESCVIQPCCVERAIRVAYAAGLEARTTRPAHEPGT